MSTSLQEAVSESLGATWWLCWNLQLWITAEAAHSLEEGGKGQQGMLTHPAGQATRPDTFPLGQ